MRLRRVEPEILDSLDPDDPAAVANRRDLRRLNCLMGCHRWVLASLRRHGRPGQRILEIGAGDGLLGRAVEDAFPGRFTGAAIDFAPRPRAWPEAWAWNRGDVLAATDWGRYDWVVCNLLLHQFDDGILGRLGDRLREVPGWLIQEPLRRLHVMAGFRLLAPALHPVSRHDGAVSIRAGFRRGELPRLLGGGEPGVLRESEHILGTYRLLRSPLDEG